MEKKRTYRDTLKAELTKMDDGSIRIIYYIAEYEMATLYFERPKAGWVRKPIMPHFWLCKDARIHEKQIYINGLVTPQDLIGWGQELIRDYHF